MIDPTAIIVAAVTGASTVAVAAVPFAMSMRKRNEKTAKIHEIVKGNGHGNVLQLSENIFKAVGRIEERVDVLDRKMDSHLNRSLWDAHPHNL